MASFEMTGKLKKIMEVQSFGTNGFTKREFVVTTDEQYPQDIMFELYKDKTSVIDKYKEGDTVKVSFNLRGREYNERFFVNLNAWRIEADQAIGDNSIPPPLDPMTATPPATAEATAPTTNIDDIGEDDLPF